jgi:hypothetical protein
MNLAVLSFAALVSTSVIAAESTLKKQPASVTLAPRDAAEVLQLLSSSEIKGADVPETYRLMALLSQIAQGGGTPQAHEASLSEREAARAAMQ